MRAVANWPIVARIALTRLGGSFIGHVRAVANWPIVARIGDPARHDRLKCLTMQASVAAGSHRADVASTASIDRSDVREALAEIRMPVAVVGSARGPRPVVLDAGGLTPEIARQDVFAVLPPIYPEWLGERGFTAAHGVRFPYVIGEMARGIATARMTVEGVRAGVMGFFGSAGLDLGAVEAGVREIQDALGREAGGWGANLIHNIRDDGLEIATVDLFHRLGVRCVSASAFMRLTPAIVLYSAKGLRRGPDGQIIRAGRIFAKVSRDEVAGQFLSPAPEAMLRALVAEGRITAEEAKLAAEIPIAEDITAEADSGGHTDNRALTVLLPRLIALRDEIAATYDYPVLPRVGAAGGIGTPAAVAAPRAPCLTRRAGGRGGSCHRRVCLTSRRLERWCGRRGRSVCPDRFGESVGGGERPVSGWKEFAFAGPIHRRGDGTRRRHVRNGSDRAGTQARHDVRPTRPAAG